MATSQPCLGSAIGVSDLIDVLDLLKRCGFPETRWYELGLRLGLLKRTLDVIEKNHPHDVSRCMTECLSQWLGRADNVDSRGGANLNSLSDALRSMNETAVAEKLKHDVLINIFNNRHTVLSQSLCDSVSIAWLLYAERMLTQEAISRVVSASPSIPNQREALLTAVKEAVQTDPNSLHTFANVLCTISTNVSLGQTILDDISKNYPTPEVVTVPGTNEDHDKVPQDTTSTDETKAIANTQSGTCTHNNHTSNSSSQSLSSQVEVPVPKHLFVEYSSMRAAYTRMFYNVCKILKRKLDVEDIKEFLSFYSVTLSRKVEQCTDISSILRHVKDECSLTNIELLHSIVKEMEISEAEEHIKLFRVELNQFYKSISISLCLKERFASIPHLQCETVTFIFDWEPEEHVLKDIKDILSKVSGKLLIIKYIKTSTSISVTCFFPFSDVGFTVLRMIENIHILMGQGLKKLTIGNLTLWMRQDVRQKELKEKDQDLLQHAEVISYIILEEAEYRLRDAISGKEKETSQLQQELLIVKALTLPKAESLSVLIVPESKKDVKEEPLHEEVTVLSSQFKELKAENKVSSDKLSRMNVDYLRSLSSNTGSAAGKVRRGIAFEIDDCKFHFQAMTSPDYQPLVDSKRIIEKLQERITLMNMELITRRECNEKIMKEIKDLKETEDKRQREKKQKVEEKNYQIDLYCNHPVTGELMQSMLNVHKDELLPQVLDKAYKLMELAPHIPFERCRLVKYNYYNHTMDQSFDLDEFQYQTIRQLVISVARGGYCSFALFLETCKENETFRKYNGRSINLLISVVDLSTGEIHVGPAKPMRGEEFWTVRELKKHIGELFNISSKCMRIVMEEKEYKGSTSVYELSDGHSSELFTVLDRGKKLYVSPDLEDYEKEFKDSLVYRYIDIHINSILLDITIPPQPEATRSPTATREGVTIMKIISMNEVKKGKERKIQVQVDKRITLVQLKRELVPLIGVPPVGFRVYGVRYNKEYEMERLNEKLKGIKSGSELIIRLGRALEEGEFRISLYFLKVNNTEFCKFMMESIVAKYTLARQFKKQIIIESKAQGIDCVLEIDKMRLRDKNGLSPGRIYVDYYEKIDADRREIYLEPLNKPEKKSKGHTFCKQLYVIRWRPSQCSIDPIDEIILDEPLYAYSFEEKLSELSGIPIEYISFTESESFPVEISYLDIENELEWYSINSSIYSVLRLYDGDVIYYKDNREKMKELTDKERSEIQETEEARLKKIKEFESQQIGSD